LKFNFSGIVSGIHQYDANPLSLFHINPILNFKTIMKFKYFTAIIVIASLAFAAGCSKKQTEEAKDETAAKTEEIKKDIVKDSGNLEQKARELEKTAEKKADEIKTDAAPKIQELQKEGMQKIDEAKAAIHDATAPTPTPAQSPASSDASASPGSMQ